MKYVNVSASKRTALLGAVVLFLAAVGVFPRHLAAQTLDKKADLGLAQIITDKLDQLKLMTEQSAFFESNPLEQERMRLRLRMSAAQLNLLLNNGIDVNAASKTNEAIRQDQSLVLRPHSVEVLGNVTKPGSVDLAEDEKVGIMQAIARAGGLNGKSDPNRIDFTHAGITRTYSMKELLAANPAKSIHVEPGDIIRVREIEFYWIFNEL